MQSQLSASTYRGVSVSRNARGEVGGCGSGGGVCVCGGGGGGLVQFCLMFFVFVFLIVILVVHYSLREIRVALPG